MRKIDMFKSYFIIGVVTTHKWLNAYIILHMAIIRKISQYAIGFLNDKQIAKIRVSSSTLGVYTNSYKTKPKSFLNNGLMNPLQDI